MNASLQIAILRARMICRREPKRAAALLIAAGVALHAAIGFVLDLLSALRRGLRVTPCYAFPTPA